MCWLSCLLSPAPTEQTNPRRASSDWLLGLNFRARVTPTPTELPPPAPAPLLPPLLARQAPAPIRRRRGLALTEKEKQPKLKTLED